MLLSNNLYAIVDPKAATPTSQPSTSKGKKTAASTVSTPKKTEPAAKKDQRQRSPVNAQKKQQKSIKSSPM